MSMETSLLFLLSTVTGFLNILVSTKVNSSFSTFPSALTCTELGMDLQRHGSLQRNKRARFVAQWFKACLGTPTFLSAWAQVLPPALLQRSMLLKRPGSGRRGCVPASNVGNRVHPSWLGLAPALAVTVLREWSKRWKVSYFLCHSFKKKCFVVVLFFNQQHWGKKKKKKKAKSKSCLKELCWEWPQRGTGKESRKLGAGSLFQFCSQCEILVLSWNPQTEPATASVKLCASGSPCTSTHEQSFPQAFPVWNTHCSVWYVLGERSPTPALLSPEDVLHPSMVSHITTLSYFPKIPMLLLGFLKPLLTVSAILYF